MSGHCHIKTSTLRKRSASVNSLSTQYRPPHLLSKPTKSSIAQPNLSSTIQGTVTNFSTSLNDFKDDTDNTEHETQYLPYLTLRRNINTLRPETPERPSDQKLKNNSMLLLNDWNLI
ncbi:unnamed protein product [Cunninghamella echinulata]